MSFIFQISSMIIFPVPNVYIGIDLVFMLMDDWKYILSRKEVSYVKVNIKQFVEIDKSELEDVISDMVGSPLAESITKAIIQDDEILKVKGDKP